MLNDKKKNILIKMKKYQQGNIKYKKESNGNFRN